MGFKVFHINSEKAILDRPISPTWSLNQKEEAQKWLESEKKRMSQAEYAQEYLGVFRDELKRFFSEELIKRCCLLKRHDGIKQERAHYLGIDVARMGEDEITFEILDRIDREHYQQADSLVYTKKYLSETTEKTLELEKLWKFKQIGIDDGGIGVGVFDYLLKHDLTKRKIVAINNRARSIDRDDSHKKKLLKEDLYNNLLGMMERGEIKFLDDDEIKQSFRSVQYEYVVKAGEMTRMRIFGKYTHIVEGLIRAAWLAAEDKHLNLWSASKSYGFN